MTEQRREPVTEFDLLAYADGNLDSDRERRAEVEAYLDAHPDVAARVHAFACQDEEIRRLYGGVIDEPVPDRLRAALEVPPRRWGGLALKSAAAAVLLVVTATGSWFLGRTTAGEAAGHGEALIEQAMTGYLDAPASATRTAHGPAGRQPLSWLSDRIALKLRTPDLTPQGFRLADKRLVASEGTDVVQVSYVNDAGRRIVLMLHPRWRDTVPDVYVDERNGVSVAYWADGPLAYGLAGDLAATEARKVAAAIRKAMRPSQDSTPRLAPEMRTGVPSGQRGVAQSGPKAATPKPGQGGGVELPNVIQHN